MHVCAALLQLGSPRMQPSSRYDGCTLRAIDLGAAVAHQHRATVATAGPVLEVATRAFSFYLLKAARNVFQLQAPRNVVSKPRVRAFWRSAGRVHTHT